MPALHRLLFLLSVAVPISIGCDPKTGDSSDPGDSTDPKDTADSSPAVDTTDTVPVDTVPVDTGTVDTGPVDTGIPEGPCVEDDARFTNLQLTLATIPTVVRVVWDTPEPEVGYLEFTVDGATYTSDREPEPRTHHELLAVGIPQASYADLRAMLDQDGPDPCSGLRNAYTGTFIETVPDISVEGGSLPDDAGLTIVPLLWTQGATSVVAILDPAGRPVWARTEHTMVTRIRLSPDRKSLLYHLTAVGANTDATIRQVYLDGTLGTDTLNRFHTDFVVLPDGTLAGLGIDTREWGDGAYVGDTIVEIAPDGTQTEVWTIWDWLEPDPDGSYPTNFDPNNPDAFDWTHINSIAWDEREDAYLVTSRHLHAVFRIRRATGEMDLTVSPYIDGALGEGIDGLVLAPHSVERTADGGYLVLNHGDYIAGCSDTRRFTVDEVTGLVEQTWMFTSDECVLMTFLGNAHEAADGTTLVAWTNWQRLDRTDASTSILQSLRLGDEWQFGYVDSEAHLGLAGE